LTQKAWGNAITAFLRANWYGGPIPEKVRKALTAELEKALTLKSARVLAVSMSRSREGGSIPRYSPLTFDSAGLLIQHAEGVLRMDLEALQEEDASEEVDPWPLTVISPQGERLMGVAYPCDRPTLTLLASTDSGGAIPIATSLLAPRPGNCGGSSRITELPLRPISWGISGLRVLLGGTEVGASASDTIPPGSARSRNGAHTVIASELGLLVLHKSSAELWRVEGVSRRLQECVIDDHAQHVACVDNGRAVLLTVIPAAPPAVPDPAPPASASASPPPTTL
jgi:hypothetical protein